MRHCWIASLIAMSAVLPAAADEMPTRKPGLWEVTMSSNGRTNLVVQQCVDRSTDQALLQSAGPISVAACAKRDVQQSGNTLTIDSTCTVDGKPATSHAVVTGSFDSAYTMDITAKGEGLQSGLNMTLTGKWMGACLAGQQPGDVIMPGGIKVNIPELQKRAPQSNDGLR
jgi:hypothetical protein